MIKLESTTGRVSYVMRVLNRDLKRWLDVGWIEHDERVPILSRPGEYDCLVTWVGENPKMPAGVEE